MQFIGVSPNEATITIVAITLSVYEGDMNEPTSHLNERDPKDMKVRLRKI